MNYLLSFDQLITAFLRNFFPHMQFFNLFFSFFSLKGNSIVVWLLVILTSLILEERKNPGISRKDKNFIILFSLSFLLAGLIVAFPLKNLFHRPRPAFAKASAGKLFLTSSCPTDFSFPSGHAATAFTAACVLTYFDKKRRWFYYIVALLISYSRIYLGCHYFFDVVAGTIIGLFISKLFLFGRGTFPSRRRS